MGRGLGLWNDLFPDLHWTILNERVRQEQNRVWRGDVGGRQEDASERLAAGRARRGDAGGRLADGWLRLVKTACGRKTDAFSS